MSQENKTKKPFYKRIWVWVVVIIVVVAIGNSGGDDTAEGNDTANGSTGNGDTEQEQDDNGGSDNNSGESSDGSKSEESEEPSDESDEQSKTAKIGEPAEVGNVTFTVNGVKKTSEINSGNEFTENATTSGKFVIADVTVKNGKDESITIDSSFFTLVANGTEYEPTTDGTVMMAMGDDMDDFFLQQINPNIEKTGKVVFEAGGDVKTSESTLEAQTGAFGTESIDISLSE